MTEQEYLTSTNPVEMLRWLSPRSTAAYENLPGRSISDRQLRLLAQALVGGKLGENWYKANYPNDPVRWWDGWLAGIKGQHDEREKGQQVCTLLRDIIGNPWRPYCCTECVQGSVPTDRDDDTCPKCGGTGGVPLRWLRWQDGVIPRLAREIYEDRGRKCERCDNGWLPKTLVPDIGMASRCPNCHGAGRTDDGTLDPARLAILGDMLEEAGCGEESLLRHLRGQERCFACLGNGTPAIGYLGTVDPPNQCWHCKGTSWRPSHSSHVRGCFTIELLKGES